MIVDYVAKSEHEKTVRLNEIITLWCQRFVPILTQYS